MQEVTYAQFANVAQQRHWTGFIQFQYENCFFTETNLVCVTLLVGEDS